jgi:GAF domain-containing protein
VTLAHRTATLCLYDTARPPLRHDALQPQTGALYLENNLTPGVFTPSRTTVLKLLALQAAISLENAYLYGDLAQAEKALAGGEGHAPRGPRLS